jgi:hypothetical protein
MSTNLFVEATIDAVSKVGNHTICSSFCLWQTPSSLTYSILENPSNEEIIKAYIEWVRSHNVEEYEKVEWDEGDPTIDISYTNDMDLNPIITGDSVRYIKTTHAKEHEKDFLLWVKSHEGWDIRFYAM